MNYSGFFRRAAASIIDAIILWIPSAFIGAGIQNIGFGTGVGLVIGLLYKPIFESSVLMATPGKALMGIVVVGENTSERITFKQAVIRFFCAYISALMLFIGYLMQPFTSKRQTLHDMVAETIVIRKESPDLNYFSVWRDQLKDVFNKL